MNRNMSYGVLRSSETRPGEHISPISGITVATPPSQHGPPSPMAMAIKSITATDRGRLFVEGNKMNFLQSMDKK